MYNNRSYLHVILLTGVSCAEHTTRGFPIIVVHVFVKTNPVDTLTEHVVLT